MISISILGNRDVQYGILFSTVATVLSFLCFFLFIQGFFALFDIYFLFGSILGIYYALKTREKGQSILKTGVVTGVIGGFISSFFISIFYSILFIKIYDFASLFFYFFGYVLISGLVIGLLAGALISAYFMYKDAREEGKIEEEDTGDDFFDELIGK